MITRLPAASELDFLGLRLSTPTNAAVGFADEPLDLERVLFKLCLHLQEQFDGRLASTLMSWMKVHGDRVHVDRLRQMRDAHAAEHHRDVHWLRYLAYFNVSLKRHNWKNLTKPAPGRANADTFYFGNDERLARRLIDRWGLEPFLPPNGKVKVHRGALRLREADVLDQKALMARNRQYRNRFQFGANVKCDVITHMGSGHFQTPAELSRFLGLSRAAVRKHWDDYRLYLEVAQMSAS